MTLSTFFDISFSSRGLLATRLAPCWKPATSVQTAVYVSNGRRVDAPKNLVVSWLLWRLVITVKVKSIAINQ